MATDTPLDIQAPNIDQPFTINYLNPPGNDTLSDVTYQIPEGFRVQPTLIAFNLQVHALGNSGKGYFRVYRGGNPYYEASPFQTHVSPDDNRYVFIIGGGEGQLDKTSHLFVCALPDQCYAEPGDVLHLGWINKAATDVIYDCRLVLKTWKLAPEPSRLKKILNALTR